MPVSRSIERDYGNVLSRAQEQTWMDEAARRLGGDSAAFRGPPNGSTGALVR